MEREVECFGDLLQPAGVNATRPFAVFLVFLKRQAENFGEVGLRKSDREPLCLDQLFDLPVGHVALRHGFALLARSERSQPIFDRDSFMNPANRFTSGSPL